MMLKFLKGRKLTECYWEFSGDAQLFLRRRKFNFIWLSNYFQRMAYDSSWNT